MRFRTESYSYLAFINPIAVLLLSRSPPDLYICGVYASPYMVIIGLTTFIILWYVIFSLRDMMRGHKLSVAAFHMLPLELFSLLVFAQYHPLLATLAVLIVLLDLLLAVTYLKHNYFFTSKQLKTLTARLCVLTCSCCFLIPSILSITVYRFQQPRYEALSQVWSQILTVESETVDTIALEDSLSEELEKLDQSEWDSIELASKMASLQGVAFLQCARLRIPAPKVEAVGLPNGTLGQYIRENDLIELSLELVKEDSLGSVEVLLHECRHKYQYEVVAAIDWSSSANGVSYFSEALDWRNNIVNYTSDGEEYYDQPIEKDSRLYAASVLPQYLPYITPNST